MPDAQLTDLVGELDRVSRRAEELAKRSEAARTELGRWSVAEHLVHLQLTTESYLIVFDEAFARGRREGLTGNGPYRLDRWGRVLRYFIGPPVRVKVKAPAAFQPASGVSAEEALAKFLRGQDQLKYRYGAADGLAIDRIKVTSPFSEKVRYSLFSAMHLVVAHQWRHIWLCERAVG